MILFIKFREINVRKFGFCFAVILAPPPSVQGKGFLGGERREERRINGVRA